MKKSIFLIFLLPFAYVFGAEQLQNSQKVTRIYIPLTIMTFKGILSVIDDTCRFSAINPRNIDHNAIIPVSDITKCRRGYSYGIPNRIVIVTEKQRYYFFSYRRAMIDAINAEILKQQNKETVGELNP